MDGKKERKLYLDGLKGIACLFIMIGHFSGIYKYATDVTSIECGFLRSFTLFPISFLTAESFWLYLFFAISGYLVASSDVVKLKDVLRKSIVRILRFLIPVIGAVIIAFVIGKTVGFHNQGLKTLLENSWFFTSYQSGFTFKDLIMEPVRVFIIGSSAFDSPLWVIRDMVLASILIYGISYLFRCNKAVTIGGYVIVCILLVGCILLKKYVIFGCTCGACGKWNEKYIRSITKFKVVPWAILLTLTGAFFLKNNFVSAVVFTLWIIAIDGSSTAKYFYSKGLLWLGSISFGIFLLHWPIYNSVGSLLIERLHGNLENNLLFILEFSVSITMVIIASILFKLTVERMTTKACQFLDDRIKVLHARGYEK